MSAVPRRVVMCTAIVRDALERLRALENAGFELVERFDLEGAQDATVIVEALRGAWATIAGNELYSRSVLEALDGLSAIARWGIGYDSVDVAAATDHGVAVLTAPGANSDAVADCAIALMLACLRRLVELDGAVRSGQWRPEQLTGDLTGATVGIVGLGAIGRAVARRLRGFDCRMLAVEVAPDPAFCAELGIEVLALEEVLPRADVLTVHAPLTAQTDRLIGERELALLQPRAVLVNTSRGPLVDEDALVRALQDGRLAGAGLDVFEREPLDPDHPLTRIPNVVLSGHAATFTRLAVQRTADAVLANLLAAGAGHLPAGCINPEAWGVAGA